MSYLAGEASTAGLLRKSGSNNLVGTRGLCLIFIAEVHIDGGYHHFDGWQAYRMEDRGSNAWQNLER